MSKMLLIASAILLLASGVLGFVNKGKIAAKQEDLEHTRIIARTAQNDATAAKAKQKKSDQAASDALAKNADLQTQFTAATSAVTELKGQVDAKTKDIDAKQAKITELEDTIKKNLAGPTGPNVNNPVGDPQAKIAEMEIQLAELKTVKEQLDSQLKSAQNQTAALQKKITDRETGASMTGLTGRVLAVNHDWNFVVLSMGNNKGVNANATMLIQRGGSTVGKVRITSVEPSQSIADIIPNSVPAGVNVQAGDTVVYPGS